MAESEQRCWRVGTDPCKGKACLPGDGGPGVKGKLRAVMSSRQRSAWLWKQSSQLTSNSLCPRGRGGGWSLTLPALPSCFPQLCELVRLPHSLFVRWECLRRLTRAAALVEGAAFRKVGRPPALGQGAGPPCSHPQDPAGGHQARLAVDAGFL